MLGQTQNPKEDCGAKRRNPLLGFMSSYIKVVKELNRDGAKIIPMDELWSFVDHYNESLLFSSSFPF